MRSSHDVCRFAGVSYRQLDHWVRNGVIRPEIVGCIGSGGARRYTDDELFFTRVVGDLMALGLSLAGCEHVISQLRNPDGTMVNGRVYVDVGGGLSRYPWAGACYVLDLDDLRERVAHALASK